MQVNAIRGKSILLITQGETHPSYNYAHHLWLQEHAGQLNVYEFQCAGLAQQHASNQEVRNLLDKGNYDYVFVMASLDVEFLLCQAGIKPLVVTQGGRIQRLVAVNLGRTPGLETRVLQLLSEVAI
jgi:hypothetical protein